MPEIETPAPASPDTNALLAELVKQNGLLAKQSEKLTQAVELLAARDGGSPFIPADNARDLAHRFMPEEELARYRYQKEEQVIHVFTRDDSVSVTTEDQYQGRGAWRGPDVEQALQHPAWRRFWEIFTAIRPMLPEAEINTYGPPDGRGRPTISGHATREQELIDLVRIWVMDYRKGTSRVCVDVHTAGPSSPAWRYDSADPCTLVRARFDKQKRVVREPQRSGVCYETFYQFQATDLIPGTTGRMYYVNDLYLGTQVSGEGKDRVMSFRPRVVDGVVRFDLSRQCELLPEQDPAAMYYMVLGNEKQPDVTDPIPPRPRGGDIYTGSL